MGCLLNIHSYIFSYLENLHFVQGDNRPSEKPRLALVGYCSGQWAISRSPLEELLGGSQEGVFTWYSIWMWMWWLESWQLFYQHHDEGHTWRPVDQKDRHLSSWGHCGPPVPAPDCPLLDFFHNKNKLFHSQATAFWMGCYSKLNTSHNWLDPTYQGMSLDWPS